MAAIIGVSVKTQWNIFCEKYFAYSKMVKSQATITLDLYAVKSIEEYLNPQSLDDLSSDNIDRWIADMKLSGKAAPTINRRLKSIKTLVNRAKEWGYVVGMIYSKRLREPRRIPHFFSPKEVKTIIFRCQGKWRTICLLGARAGLRRAEIHWLKWSDVDFTRNTVCVSPKREWNPKDFDSRTIPMAEDLRQWLSILDQSTEWVLSPRVSLDVMTTYFRRIIRELGLLGGIHTLRHTFASHLVEAGVPIYTVSKLLGHSDVKTTEIYAHLTPDAFNGAISKLPKL